MMRTRWALAVLLAGTISAFTQTTQSPFRGGDSSAKGPKPKSEVASPAVVSNAVGMKLALIPAGKFEMGSARYKAKEEKPHPVRITRPFYLP